MHLIEVHGKSTRGLRKVFILLTPDIVNAIKYILHIRIYAGVNPNNKFVFGRTTSSPLDACTAMRTVTESCPGLKRPELILSRLLRKYLATTSQVMDMTSDELKLVADHMGHSIEIQTNVYKLQPSILERTKVAKALIALENGKLGKLRGKSLQAIDIEEIPKPFDEGDAMEDDMEDAVENADENVMENDMEDSIIEGGNQELEFKPTPKQG